jgi:pimeloyl-[acyl-carrier protein] methyl ester esterase
MTHTIIAYHGWGFDQACWQPWQEQLAQRGSTLLVGDRGYFNTPFLPSISQRTIIFAHSYGLHLCPIEQLQRTDLLVLFSSFLSFHPASEAEGRRSLARNSKRSRLMLAQMINQFELNPQLVLENFKAECYYPVPWEQPLAGISKSAANGYQAINFELLLHDLRRLSDCSFDSSILSQIPQVLVLHGAQDRIVSPEKGRELCRHLPDNSEYIEIEQAGHGLPFTHIDACDSWIFQRLGTA